MAAIQAFTDPAAASAESESCQGFRRLLLGAFPGQQEGLRAGADQAPAWLRGRAGQERLQKALASVKEVTDTPGRSALFPLAYGAKGLEVRVCECRWGSLSRGTGT